MSIPASLWLLKKVSRTCNSSGFLSQKKRNLFWNLVNFSHGTRTSPQILLVSDFFKNNVMHYFFVTILFRSSRKTGTKFLQKGCGGLYHLLVWRLPARWCDMLIFLVLLLKLLFHRTWKPWRRPNCCLHSCWLRIRTIVRWFHCHRWGAVSAPDGGNVCQPASTAEKIYATDGYQVSHCLCVPLWRASIEKARTANLHKTQETFKAIFWYIWWNVHCYPQIINWKLRVRVLVIVCIV